MALCPQPAELAAAFNTQPIVAPEFFASVILRAAQNVPNSPFSHPNEPMARIESAICTNGGRTATSTTLEWADFGLARAVFPVGKELLVRIVLGFLTRGKSFEQPRDNLFAFLSVALRKILFRTIKGTWVYRIKCTTENDARKAKFLKETDEI
jgi:hypothetical protein